MARNKISRGQSKSKEAADRKPEISLSDIRIAFRNGYGKRAIPEGPEEFAEKFSTFLKQEVYKHPVAAQYNIVVLFDNTVMIKGDSDSIYKAAKDFGGGEKKPLLLILVSNGGEPGSAYLIGKLCREFSNGKFISVVPRHAKSAATLLSCAAEEIHMGSLSELGPIDPQINGMPTLGLKNSIEHIVDLVAKTPSSGEMFAQYLKLAVEPVQIGYYERVAESAAQYAERLLNTHKATLTAQPADIASRLVKEYKDHGFVIDKEEATAIFGQDTVKMDTPEYLLGDAVYAILSSIETLANMSGFRFYFIGSLDAAPVIQKRAT